MQPGGCSFYRSLPVFSQNMLLTSLSASKSDTSREAMLRKLLVQSHQKAIKTAISETLSQVVQQPTLTPPSEHTSLISNTATLFPDLLPSYIWEKEKHFQARSLRIKYLRVC